MKRADGRRIKNGDTMYTIAAFIMNKRYDAMNAITLDIPVEPMRVYRNEARKKGQPVSRLAVLLAAYLRTAAEYPQLNRFVVNKRIYARNEFAVAMVVLKEGMMDHGTMSKVYFDVRDDVFTVQRKMDEYIEKNRNNAEGNSTEKIMKKLTAIPGVLPLGIAVFKWMDKHGLLPKSIIDASPFHASMVISDLASIRTNHIYHHCYEFGTTSIVMTMGNLREVPRRTKDEIVFDKCMPLGVVMDERICSGSYFAMAFRRFKEYMNDPKLLEGEPRIVREDTE